MISKYKLKYDETDTRDCDNCGRFIDRKHGCGNYVDTCMQNYDAFSHWIPREENKEEK